MFILYNALLNTISIVKNKLYLQLLLIQAHFMLNIALFGPPGAGKGTQSDILVEKYNLHYISTGDLLRKEIAGGTQLGHDAKNIIAKGGLVSDEIIVQIIEKTIVENSESHGFLFDGFPRTYVQAYILAGLMIKLHTSLNCLISLELDEEESVNRLMERGKTSGRSDDNEMVIRNRLREYYDKTLPVLQVYKDKGIYAAIDSKNSIDQVNSDVDKVIQNELSKNLLNIVLFGIPGSGRGTQGIMLAKKYGLEYISIGTMLEDEIKKKSKIGLKIKEQRESGLLAPDEIIVQLIEQKLENTKGAKGFIFKGFPRTLVQSYILDGLLQQHGSAISEIIDIEVPTLDAMSRLHGRSKNEYAKAYDKSTDKIINRMHEYEKKTLPVIEKYKTLHNVKKIDGVGTFDEVFERVSNEIEIGFRNL